MVQFQLHDIMANNFYVFSYRGNFQNFIAGINFLNVVTTDMSSEKTFRCGLAVTSRAWQLR